MRALILILTLLLIFQILEAQSVSVRTYDGKAKYLNLSDVRNISFQSDNMIVSSPDGSSFSCELTSIQAIYFSDSIITDNNELLTNQQFFSVYPNPVNDYLIIEYQSQPNGSLLHLIVYSIDGKEVLNQQVSSLYKFNVYTLPKGIYIATIANEEKICTCKFIKQ